MRPGSAAFRYAGVSNQFARVHHGDHGEQPKSWRGVATPINPFLARWPQVGEHTDTDNTSAAERGGTDAGRARDAASIAAELTGHWPRPSTDEGLIPLLTAADRAQVLYPGPVGELIHREIRAYLEIGHRFGGNTLISRLAAQLLATPDAGCDAAAGDRCSPGVPR